MRADERPSSAGLRVLVIDDEELVRRIIARTLTAAGHTVCAAGSLRDALRTLRGSAFDLVLTDVYMPEADGFEALRAVRDVAPSVPVVVISGRFTSDDFGANLALALRRLGARATLSKPVSAARLVAVVEHVQREAADHCSKQ